MHNGGIEQFTKIRRRLQQQLPDEIFNVVNGNTDSEWSFALFLSKVCWSWVLCRRFGRWREYKSFGIRMRSLSHTPNFRRQCWRPSRPSINLQKKLVWLRCVGRSLHCSDFKPRNHLIAELDELLCHGWRQCRCYPVCLVKKWCGSLTSTYPLPLPWVE